MSEITGAVEAGSFQEVKRLVENGADVNEKDEKYNTTVLHIAAKSSSLEIVKYLVEHGAIVNYKDWWNRTPLHLAVESGAIYTVKYLIEQGANVNCKNDFEHTALHYASIYGSLEMVKYLVEHGANVTSEDRQGSETVLYRACENGNDLIVDYLLQHGAIQDIDKYNEKKWTSPLRVACLAGHTAVVRTLLKFNLDIRKEKKLICRNDEIIRILNLELKKSVEHQNKIWILKTMEKEKLTKVGPPVKYFSSQKSLSLGKGSMGTCVYAGILEDGSEVAVKKMLIEASEDAAENEKNILSLIETKKSPYIVSYRNFLKDSIFFYLIVDLCEKTLNAHVNSQSIEYLREHGPRMVKEILTGLTFLHDQGILHRDLKPSNVLVDVEGHMRLADFGMSRVLNDDETTVYTDAKGTQGWMPTEVMEAIDKPGKCGYKKKSDVQATGMITFFILTKGEHPFGVSHQRMTNIKEGNPLNLEKLDDLCARKFVLWLINHNIKDRPYAFEALSHSFMNKIKIG